MWCKMICSGGTENVVLDYRGQSLPQLRGSGGMPFPTLLILSGQHLLGAGPPAPLVLTPVYTHTACEMY